MYPSMKMSAAAAKVLGMLGACLAISAVHADTPPTEIRIPGERVVPESLTSDKQGVIYIGSIAARTIYRVPAGASTAEPWIQPGTDGLQLVLGVYADGRSKTLWACSVPDPDPPQAGEAPPPSSALYAFDLETGAPKGHYPFPTERAMCNDIAVAADGTAYATDAVNEQVVRLRKGAKALEVWSAEGAFGAKGVGLDGINIIGNTMYVNTFNTSKLFAVPIGRDGKSGATTEVQLDRALDRPDGMRTFGKDQILVVEGGAGRLSKIVFDESGAGKVTTLGEGYADNAVSVAVVGETGYVLEAQFKARRDPSYVPKPFRATAVHVGKP